MTHPYFDLPTPLILGHRGAAGVAPENTLIAFERGLADGAHIIESDIHVTQDGVPVLIHDPDLDRTTSGSGPVVEQTFADLQQLNAGCSFRMEGSEAPSYADQGIRVPSVREAFERFPDALFNFEIKTEARNVIDSVLALIREFDREDRTLLVAGEDAAQASLRQALAESGIRPALGASLGDIVDIIRGASEGQPHSSDSMAIQIPLHFGEKRLVTQELIAHCRAHRVQVHVWTINDPDVMSELLDQGVDGIVTDRPDIMASLVAARS
ncbi:MAG: glycerophosphodiester phosphodiesterase [Myxococcota bacterium]|nr:glycerophosphodiester phosphodiesterase [Myxococcota bacterium]